MHKGPFFTSHPRSNQHTWLFFKAHNIRMWMRMVLHVPHEKAIKAVQQGLFIPFEDAIPVSPSDTELGYANAPDGTELLEHIAAQIDVLTRPRAEPLDGMHPNAEECWVRNTQEFLPRQRTRMGRS
jgi:hypothetical protein